MGVNFHVKLAPCLVTKQLDRCLSVKLGEVKGEGDQVAEVFGNFSEAGLLAMLEDLRSVTRTPGTLSAAEVRRSSPYGWLVIYDNGTILQQYDEHGNEMAFALVDLPQVIDFWIIPTESEDLPAYALSREYGFVRCPKSGVEIEPLMLPWPEGETWEWHYYRRNTIAQQIVNGEVLELPPHVVQVLGWRVGTTVFEIGIEGDGSWQIYRKEPLDDPRFAAPAGVIHSNNPVRIIDPLGE